MTTIVTVKTFGHTVDVHTRHPRTGAPIYPTRRQLPSQVADYTAHDAASVTVVEVGMVDAPVTESLTFGGAIEALKAGKRVARGEGWNGKGMFLFLVAGSTFTVNRPPLLGIYPEGTQINYQPHIDMKTAQGTVVPWVASQSDMLADDWMVVA